MTTFQECVDASTNLLIEVKSASNKSTNIRKKLNFARIMSTSVTCVGAVLTIRNVIITDVSLLLSVTECIDASTNLLREVNLSSDKSKSIREKLNVSKIVGTGVTCVGAALTIRNIIFTDITFLHAITGIVLSVLGGVVNTGTDYIEYKINNKTIHDLINKLNNKERVFSNYNRTLRRRAQENGELNMPKGLPYGRLFEEINDSGSIKNYTSKFLHESKLKIPFKIVANTVLAIILNRTYMAPGAIRPHIGTQIVAGGFAAALAVLDIMYLLKSLNSSHQFTPDMTYLREELMSEISDLKRRLN